MFVFEVLADEDVEDDEDEYSHEDEGEVFQLHATNNP